MLEFQMTPVNAKMLADVFSLTETRVHQLAAREGMPKLERAKFDLISCITWYMKYLRTKIEERSVRPGPEITEIQHQKFRRMRVAADLKEMDVALMKEQLMKVEDVRSGFADMVFIVRARFKSVPATLSAEFLGETSRVMIQAKIEKAIRKSLNEIADDGKNYPFRK
jgi:phage terminase Nu1 subunit (DNA packaging protein)